MAAATRAKPPASSMRSSPPLQKSSGWDSSWACRSATKSRVRCLRAGACCKEAAQAVKPPARARSKGMDRRGMDELRAGGTSARLRGSRREANQGARKGGHGPALESSFRRKKETAQKARTYADIRESGGKQRG